MNRLRKAERLEGRITSDKQERQRHQALIVQVNSIIARARDSTLMDAEYDARRLIEQMFACHPIEVALPPNEWAMRTGVIMDTIRDRALSVGLYQSQVKTWLENQGVKVKAGLSDSPKG